MPTPSTLRALLAEDAPFIVPGASDALTARIIERAGFPAVYVTGAGIANTALAVPDVGLITLTEMVSRVRAIAEAVDVPVIADADTGYGGVANVQRTIREYEDAGVAALHLEDQEMPKRCGHFEGKAVVPVREMQIRLQAALDTRRSPDFLIFARTDARSIEGLDAAIARGKAYLATGADGLFVEAPESIEELQRVADAFPGVALIANMVEGGKTPLVPAAELKRMGYAIVLYANAAMRIGAFAVQQGLRTLRETGTTASLLDRMISWDERQALVRLDDHDRYERDLARRIDQL
jgi:2-methylisocitrate lyase-like PEP mutase family enzyme